MTPYSAFSTWHPEKKISRPIGRQKVTCSGRLLNAETRGWYGLQSGQRSSSNRMGMNLGYDNEQTRLPGMNWTERPIKRSALKGRAMDDDICRNRQMQLWLLGVQTYMQAGRQPCTETSRGLYVPSMAHTLQSHVASTAHRSWHSM